MKLVGTYFSFWCVALSVGAELNSQKFTVSSAMTNTGCLMSLRPALMLCSHRGPSPPKTDTTLSLDTLQEESAAKKQPQKN